MKTRIDRKFAELKKAGRKGFIAYITAGDPSVDDCIEIALELDRAGVDIIELGIPFSDPLADGPVNQAAAMRALEAGATLPRVLEIVRRIRERSQVPLMCYTYTNPLAAPGFEKSVSELATAGVDGLLILDLPVEESHDELAILKNYNVNNVALVTPTSPDERIKKIVKRASGFVYIVSREGVTGMQSKLSDGANALVERTRKHTNVPLALGFGISSPETARAAAEASDGIVVGSAIVDRFWKAPHTPEGRREVGLWVASLVAAVKAV